MSDGLANPMIQIAARTLHLTNDVAVLRCTVGDRQWLLGDDPEVGAAFATLNRKLREKTVQLKATRQGSEDLDRAIQYAFSAADAACDYQLSQLKGIDSP